MPLLFLITAAIFAVDHHRLLISFRISGTRQGLHRSAQPFLLQHGQLASGHVPLVPGRVVVRLQPACQVVALLRIDGARVEQAGQVEQEVGAQVLLGQLAPMVLDENALKMRGNFTEK